MKNKNKIMFFTIIVMAIIISLETMYIFKNNSIKDKKDDSQEKYYVKDFKKESEKVKSFLQSYEEFKNSKINLDEEKETIVLDDKYEIGIMGGYIILDIGYEDDRETICKIVDSIEKGLGQKEDSIETCKNILDGKYDSDFMNVNYQNEQMVVTVSTTMIGKLDNLKTFKSDELIELESRNFKLSIDNYNFSHITSGYNKENEMTEVCFAILNLDKNPRDFTVKYYDLEKKLLHEEKVSYNGTDVPSEFTCARWNSENNAKYFSIN